MFGGRGVIAGLRQNEAADARVQLCIPVILVAGSESVGGAELVVDSRANVGACTRVGNTLIELDGAGVRAKLGRIHDRYLIDVAALHGEKERCLLVDRPADVPHINDGIIRCLRSTTQVRIARITFSEATCYRL